MEELSGAGGKTTTNNGGTDEERRSEAAGWTERERGSVMNEEVRYCERWRWEENKEIKVNRKMRTLHASHHHIIKISISGKICVQCKK